MSCSSDTREWNAAAYDRHSKPQFHWGQKVLSQLRLRGDECVLDAGCGSGRLTRILAEGLPRGRIVGVDLSRNMVQHARQNLADLGPRVAFIAADLVALPFHSCFDGVVSTAAFHWVLDHDELFANLFAALRPSGWLHAQCGGGPNLARLRSRVKELGSTREFAPSLHGFREPWFFADAESAAVRLRHAGFVDVKTSLEEAPVHASTADEFKDYLRTFILHQHLESLPNETAKAEFVDHLAAIHANDDPPWTLDYWRLNLRGRKAA
jgi:trans-aconitate 2-methyltransferase